MRSRGDRFAANGPVAIPTASNYIGTCDDSSRWSASTCLRDFPSSSKICAESKLSSVCSAIRARAGMHCSAFTQAPCRKPSTGVKPISTSRPENYRPRIGCSSTHTGTSCGTFKNSRRRFANCSGRTVLMGTTDHRRPRLRAVHRRSRFRWPDRSRRGVRLHRRGSVKYDASIRRTSGRSRRCHARNATDDTPLGPPVSPRSLGTARPAGSP